MHAHICNTHAHAETMKRENRIPPIANGRGSRMAAPSADAEIAECCCMCGDPGLPHELLPCGSCRSRFQHRYCSNQYPGASSYGTCNWCLSNGGSTSGKQGRTSSQKMLVSSYESLQKTKPGKRLVGQMKKRSSPGTPLLRWTSARDGDSSGEPGMRKGATWRAGIARYKLRNRAVRRYKLLEEVAA